MRFIVSIGILILMCSLAPGTVEANAGRDYGESIQALRQERWDKAEDAIRSALSKESEAKESILISGGVRFRYIPYYFLGAALAGKGDCDGAIDAWRESLNQGQIQNAESEFASMQEGMVQCGTSLAEVQSGAATPSGSEEPVVESQPAPQPAPEPVAEPEPVISEEFIRLADANARALEQLRQANSRYQQLASDADLRPEWAGNWKQALDDSRAAFTRLEQSLQQANQRAETDPDVANMQSIANQSEAAIDAIRARQAAAEQRIGVLSAERIAENQAREEERRRQAALEEERRQVALREQRAAEERRLALEQRQRVEAAQQVLQQELNRVSRQLNETAGDETVVASRSRLAELVFDGNILLASESVEALSQHTQAVRDGLRSYSQAFQEWEAQQREVALRTPPDELRQIAEAYFSGDYEQVISLSNPAGFTDERQRVQAYLFRSAARFNHFWLTGGENQSLLAQSRQDILEIKRINDGFIPYVAAFSPRFMDFFQDS